MVLASRVAYSFLHRVVDADAMKQDVIELDGSPQPLTSS